MKVSDHRKAMDAANLEVARLVYAYTHCRDAEFNTGKIPGCDSKYTLRVWYRNAETLGMLIHRHPGQSDTIVALSDLGGSEFNHRASTAYNEESHAIARMIHEAREAERAHFRADAAVAV